MSESMLFVVAIAGLAAGGLAAYRLGYSAGLREVAARNLRLAESWERARGEPPTTRANLVGMRGGRS